MLFHPLEKLTYILAMITAELILNKLTIKLQLSLASLTQLQHFKQQLHFFQWKRCRLLRLFVASYTDGGRYGRSGFCCRLGPVQGCFGVQQVSSVQSNTLAMRSSSFRLTCTLLCSRLLICVWLTPIRSAIASWLIWQAVRSSLILEPALTMHFSSYTLTPPLCTAENIVPSLSYFAESLVLFTETLKTFVKTIFASILAHLYPPARHTNWYFRRSLVIYCPYGLIAAEVTAWPQLVKFFPTAKNAAAWCRFYLSYSKKGIKKPPTKVGGEP